MYQLTTNEGVQVVRGSEAKLRKAMWEYVAAKKREGKPLASVLFSWRPIRVKKLA